MRALPRAQYVWRPWDVFFAQIEGDGQSLCCLVSISLLFYPLTPFVTRSCRFSVDVYLFSVRLWVMGLRVFGRLGRLGSLGLPLGRLGLPS